MCGACRLLYERTGEASATRSVWLTIPEGATSGCTLAFDVDLEDPSAQQLRDAPGFLSAASAALGAHQGQSPQAQWGAAGAAAAAAAGAGGEEAALPYPGPAEAGAWRRAMLERRLATLRTPWTHGHVKVTLSCRCCCCCTEKRGARAPP